MVTDAFVTFFSFIFLLPKKIPIPILLTKFLHTFLDESIKRERIK